MSELDYEKLVQKALRHVIKQILQKISRHGMPGDHHFLITFATKFPGVVCPDYLIEEHPEEITIILQHEYENLRIFDDCIKVSLMFDDILEEITVPYDSIICFVDPHVKFGLHFDTADLSEDTQDKNNKKDSQKSNNVINLDAFRNKKK